MFVLTRAVFANNKILSAVSTEFERKQYLAKMNNYPDTWCRALSGEKPREARGPIQHRLHRLKAGPERTITHGKANEKAHPKINFSQTLHMLSYRVSFNKITFSIFLIST